MNLPNKLTVLRICMIPIFILVVGLPLDWGQFNVGDTTGCHTASRCSYFALASITDWLDGKLPVREALSLILASLRTRWQIKC